MTTRAIDICNSCSRVDLVGPSGACLACRYEDEPECPTSCHACSEPIQAGEPVHVYGYADGTTLEVCDRCDTNGPITSVRHRWTRTRAHACGCRACQSKRLVAQLRASLRGAA